jgi:hypothetical protein
VTAFIGASARRGSARADAWEGAGENRETALRQSFAAI